MIKPAVFENLYYSVKKFLPNNNELIIAGGCLRDYFNNRSSFKDVDFFVDCNRKDFELFTSNLSKTYGEGKNIDNPSIVYDGVRHLVGVKEFSFRFGTPFQIIGIQREFRKTCSFEKEVLKTFDLSINCSYYNGTEFVETSEARLDRDCLTMTIKTCRTGTELVKVVDKFKRLKENKYPEFSLHFTGESFIN